MEKQEFKLGNGPNAGDLTTTPRTTSTTTTATTPKPRQVSECIQDYTEESSLEDTCHGNCLNDTSMTHAWTSTAADSQLLYCDIYC